MKLTYTIECTPKELVTTAVRIIRDFVPAVIELGRQTNETDAGAIQPDDDATPPVL